MKWRLFVVFLLGAVGGLACAATTRLIFNLAVIPKPPGSVPLAFGVAAGAGAVVLLLAATLMGQSSANFPKRVVIVVLLIASDILGMIVCAGFLLVLRFTNAEFYQGQGIVDAILAVAASGGIAALLFLAAVPVRGFSNPRLPGGGAPERFEVRIKSKTLERLSRKSG